SLRTGQCSSFAIVQASAVLAMQVPISHFSSEASLACTSDLTALMSAFRALTSALVARCGMTETMLATCALISETADSTDPRLLSTSSILEPPADVAAPAKRGNIIPGGGGRAAVSNRVKSAITRHFTCLKHEIACVIERVRADGPEGFLTAAGRDGRP